MCIFVSKLCPIFQNLRKITDFSYPQRPILGKKIEPFYVNLGISSELKISITTRLLKIEKIAFIYFVLLATIHLYNLLYWIPTVTHPTVAPTHLDYTTGLHIVNLHKM